MNKYKKYLFLGLIAIVVVVVAWSATCRSSLKPLPTKILSDMTLSQYGEGPSAVMPVVSISDINKPIVPLVAGCSLRFSLTPHSKIVNVGENVVYTAVISNAGDEICQNVSFSLYYSDNETFVRASPKPTSSDYYWTVGNLSPRKTITVSIITKQQSVTSPFQIWNEACATADNSKDVCPENVIFLGSQSGMVKIENATQNQINLPRSSSELPLIHGEYGVWVWQSPIEMAPNYVFQMIQTLEANRFNAVYVTIDDYLNIASLPNGSSKDLKKYAYMQRLSDLVKVAQRAHIAVDVEGGAKDWAMTENRWKGFALIDFVSEYNKLYPTAKVRGLQYDVEPYLLQSYEDNQVSVLTDFVSFIDESARRMKNVDASFAVVIPHFYDSEQKWTSAITYNNRTKYTFSQLLEVLKVKPDSQIIIMAYRNYFSGSDGVSDLVSPEIDETTAGGYKTKIIVAQETGNVDPPYVTYYNMPRTALFGTIQNILQTFESQSAFGGVAVHYLDPYLQLE